MVLEFALTIISYLVSFGLVVQEVVVAEAYIEAEASSRTWEELEDLRRLKDSPATSEMNPRQRCTKKQFWFLEPNLKIFCKLRFLRLRSNLPDPT